MSNCWLRLFLASWESNLSITNAIRSRYCLPALPVLWPALHLDDVGKKLTTEKSTKWVKWSKSCFYFLLFLRPVKFCTSLTICNFAKHSAWHAWSELKFTLSAAMFYVNKSMSNLVATFNDNLLPWMMSTIWFDSVSFTTKFLQVF